jgi:hypothetical protein
LETGDSGADQQYLDPVMEQLRSRGASRGVVILAVVLAGLAPAPAAFAECGVVPAGLRMPNGEVGDAFLSFLVAAIDGDCAFRMDSVALHRELPEYSGGRSKLLDLIRELTRRKGPQRTELEFTLFGDLHVPVPFGILGYYPIWIDTSGSIALGETRYTSHAVARADGTGVVVAPAYVYRLVAGHASVRIDRWLTILTVGLLADFSFEGVAVFRYRGSWCALLAGRRSDGKQVSWLFSLTALRVVLPMPDELDPLAADLLSVPS